MKKSSLLAVSALLSGIVTLQASNFQNASGLSGVGIVPGYTNTFDNAGYSANSLITNQFSNSGIGFSAPVYYDGNQGQAGCAFNDITGDCITNFQAVAGAPTNITPVFSILFSNLQTYAAFAIATSPNGNGNSLVQAYRGSTLVESALFTTNVGGLATSPNFVGFYNETGGFDSIKITTSGGGLAIIDNLQASNLTSVPEPGTMGLLALGMGGVVAIARRRRSA